VSEVALHITTNRMPKMNTKEDLHIYSYLCNKQNHENILNTTHAQSENSMFETILHIKQTNHTKEDKHKTSHDL
jgi:hypothetical protein